MRQPSEEKPMGVGALRPPLAAWATRRALLGLALAAPGVAFPLRAFSKAACVDFNALPANQKAARQALHFKLVSDDPKKRCGGCAFYTAGQGDCGNCQIFNGPVPAQGRCDSWSARE
jgi:hypothetical protein